MSIIIVFLAHNPKYQSLACLSIMGFCLFMNFCICPYEDALRILFHIS